MKSRMMLDSYPFICRNKLVCDNGSLIRLSGSPDRIPARLVYEAPVGKSGTLAESILGDTKQVWDPAETYILLTVMFRQNYELRSIGIRCDAPLVADIDGIESMSFYPPATEHKITLSTQTIRMRIKATNIRISQLCFFGKPNHAFVPSPRKPLEEKHRSVRLNSTGEPSQCIPQYDESEMKHDIKFKDDTRVSGIAYESLSGVKGMRVLSQTAQDDIFSFTFPINCDGPATVWFPSVLQCAGLLVFYIPKDNYRPPQIVRIHTDLTMRRTASMTFVKT